MRLGLLLADDHEVIRQGLRSLLEKQDDFEVLGEVGDGREAVRLAESLKPDVVVTDVVMPTLNGIEATRQIKAKQPGVAVLALTVQNTGRHVGQMLRAGASGYVLKSCTFEEVATAIRAVGSGQTYLCAAVAELVVSYFVRGQQGENAEHFESLTPREREVLQLLAEGMATRQIAGMLKISVKTIETHRYQLMRKLKLRGVADLTRFALREGISSLDE